MIKSIGLLTRKDGLSHDEFVKHWYEVHAPLAHAVPGVRRYVQSHILEERTRPDILCGGGRNVRILRSLHEARRRHGTTTVLFKGDTLRVARSGELLIDVGGA